MIKTYSQGPKEVIAKGKGFYFNPKDHLTLEWKGLNLYCMGSGLKIASFDDVLRGQDP